jgi:hypothetical protein
MEEIRELNELPIPVSSHFAYFESEEARDKWIEGFATLEGVKEMTGDNKHNIRLTMQFVSQFYDEGKIKFSEYIKSMEFLIKKYKE